MSDNWNPSPYPTDQERDCLNGPPNHPRARNGATIRTSFFSGTSGPPEWESRSTPYVQLTVRLPTDRPELHAKLTDALKAFTDQFIADNGLDPK